MTSEAAHRVLLETRTNVGGAYHYLNGCVFLHPEPEHKSMNHQEEEHEHV